MSIKYNTPNNFYTNNYYPQNERNAQEYGKTKYHIQMQDTLKLEEQAFSNDILCRMLSAAECYHNRLLDLHNQQEIFGYYNGFNSGNTKNTEKLKKQLLHEIEVFKTSMEDYYDNYKKYDFPNNLPKSKVQEILINWKNDLENQKNPQISDEAKYYDGILNLINGDYDKVSYRSEIKKMNQGKFNRNGTVAKQLAKNLPYVQEKAEYLSKKVREAALRGDTNINVVLNGNFTDDKYLNRGKAHFDTLEQNTQFINNFNNDYNNNNNMLIDYEEDNSNNNISDNNSNYNYNHNKNENMNQKELEDKILQIFCYFWKNIDFYLYVTEKVEPKFMKYIPPYQEEKQLIDEINQLIIKFKQFSVKFLSEHWKSEKISQELMKIIPYVYSHIKGKNGIIQIMSLLHYYLKEYNNLF